MINRLEGIKKRVSEIHDLLANPEISSNRDQVQTLGKELSKLEPVLALYEKFQAVEKELSEAEHLLKSGSKDEEMLAMYRDEHEKLLQSKKDLEAKLEDVLLGDNGESDVKSIIIEIRAGTGGEEASLFAKDLFRMYTRYAQNMGFSVDVMNTNITGKGGLKEVIFGVSGEGVYPAFKYESGIHRVQRVPETEASGRVHTSAATVAIMEEADEVDIEIKTEDLRIEVCRAGGPGGQGVNTTDSAVQIFHLPTGLMVRCQDERSQLKNKAKALRVLRARLLQAKQEEQDKKMTEARRSQVGSGDRSGKIRTYNFPDNRVTDHRIGLTLHSLSDILNGHLTELVSGLRSFERAQRLAAQKDTK